MPTPYLVKLDIFIETGRGIHPTVPVDIETEGKTAEEIMEALRVKGHQKYLSKFMSNDPRRTEIILGHVSVESVVKL